MFERYALKSGRERSCPFRKWGHKWMTKKPLSGSFITSIMVKGFYLNYYYYLIY